MSSDIMNGKLNAIGLTLLMIASALAGCTSGDPDGDGELGIDTDVLNQMIEDNLQDFINNSSVTVHQTIHYHNNTTFVDNSESNTNVGGSAGNGSSDGSIIQVVRIQDSESYETEDVGNNTFVLDGILQYPAIGLAPDLIYTVDSNTISLSLTCNDFRNAYSRMSEDDWQEWLEYEKGLSSSDAHYIGEDIREDLVRLYDEATQYCALNINSLGQYFSSTMLVIDLSAGETIEFISLSDDWHWNISCEDGYFDAGIGQSQQYYNDFYNTLFGGWEDCTFSIYQMIGASTEWESIRMNSSIVNSYSIPNWYEHSGESYWYYLEAESGISEHDSIVYYRKYFVVPLE